MRRVLFLDIDGVLNSRLFWRLFPGETIDWQACERLNQWIQANGVEVVITSTWRTPFTEPFNLEGLRKAIPFVDNIESMTLDLDVPNGRSGEIKAWLSEHPDVHCFVILDDNGAMDCDGETNCGFSFEEDLQSKAVRIDPKVGLTDQDLQQASKILRQES
jgi:hypothetical protein